MKLFASAALAAASVVSVLVPAGPAAGQQTVWSSDLGTGVWGTCWDGKGSWSCTVSAEVAESRSFYAPPRKVGDITVNCTRETVRNQRDVTVRRPGAAELTGGSTPAGVRRPTRFTWSEETTRTLTETIQPNEASWFEVQQARETGTASFTITDDAGRVQIRKAEFDGPGLTLPDRLFQKTGPLNREELAGCRR
ncbi:hypothetical protein LG634_02915 [Streptomyces bambusae]|uniref:hypothetical protein n=1 Tax=Streptomyces bambusae TaxID=1550616 RepID=UPI001CFE7357|nr:hypothetical protein [Streptomyces bambusae]MCB5163795.1 hypothetical protein [Streptomyces bambusae]